jgi:hypothetical protein
MLAWSYVSFESSFASHHTLLIKEEIQFFKPEPHQHRRLRDSQASFKVSDAVSIFGTKEFVLSLVRESVRNSQVQRWD